jgi:hypothetical protein
MICAVPYQVDLPALCRVVEVLPSGWRCFPRQSRRQPLAIWLATIMSLPPLKELETEGQESFTAGKSPGRWPRHIVGGLASLLVVLSATLLVVQPHNRLTTTILASIFFVGWVALVLAWGPLLRSWQFWTLLAGAVAAALLATSLLLALLQILPVDEKTASSTAPSAPTSASPPTAVPNSTERSSSGLRNNCLALAAKAGNESRKLRILRNSIQTESGRVSDYKTNFEPALEDVSASVDESDNALAAFRQVGGQLPTVEEVQRKFPDDFEAIRADLDTLRQKRIDENSYQAWNQLADYRTDSDAIARMVC